METNVLLTTREIADRLRVTVTTVRAWVAENKIPAKRIGGKTLRFDWQEVLAALGRPQEVRHG